MEASHAWLEAEQLKHLPKGPMGDAIKYALNQWDALRVCALGRNYADFVIMRSSVAVARGRRPFRLFESA
jgi:transposase IS66 family protein